MNRRSKLGVLPVLLALGMLAAGIGAAHAQAKEKVVTVGQTIDISSLNPYGDINTITFAMWKHIMEPLILFDFDKKEYYGVLAESWTRQGTDYVFKIRKGVKFHDGTELTARDVKFSLDTAMKGIQAVILKNVIKSVDVVDDQTVKVTTPAPFGNLLARLKHIVIVSQKAYEKYGADITSHPIGTGPFEFVEWKKGSHFVVARAKNYWGTPAKLDRVIWRPIPEDAARVTALEAGQIDVATAIPPHDLARLDKKDSVRVEKIRALRQLIVGLSPRVEPFRNVQVRKAVNHAVDVDYIIKNVLDGMAVRAIGPSGPQQLGYDPNLKAYAYDPRKAKELLAQAGYPNGFDVVFNTSVGRYVKDREFTQVLVDQLAKVGIRAKLAIEEHSVHWSGVTKGKFGMFLTGAFNEEDPELFLALYYETGVTPRIGISDPKFDELLKAMRTSATDAERDKYLRQINAYVHDDMVPILTLWHPIDLYGVNERLQWKPNPNEEMYFHRAELK